MRYIRIIFILTLFFASLHSKSIVFAPLPMEKAEIVIEQYKPMLEYLSSHLDREFIIEYFADYSELMETFAEGKIDIAYLGPLPLVELSNRYEYALPLIGFNDTLQNRGYTCCLIARKESDIFTSNSLDNLKSVALPQHFSTCGYLMTQDMLSDFNQSLQNLNYIFLSSHSNSLLQTILGHTEISGAKCDIAKKYLFHNIVIVKESREVPGFALVVNTKTLDSETIEHIKNAFLALQNSNEFEDITKKWGSQLRNGFYLIEERDYDVIYDALKKIPSGVRY